MAMFALVLFIILVLLQIPALRKLLIPLLVICVIAFLIGWGYFFNEALNKYDNKEGYRR